MQKYLTLKYRIIATINVSIVLTLLMFLFNVFTLSERRDAPKMWTYLSVGGALATMLEVSVKEVVSSTAEIRENANAELPRLMSAFESRFDALIEGDEQNGVPRIRNEGIRRAVETSREEWRENARPLIERVRQSPDSEQTPVLIESIVETLELIKSNADSNVAQMQEIMTTQLNGSIRNQYVFLIVVVVLLVIFGSVLRRVFTAVEDTIKELNAISSELYEGTSQQSTSAHEQAAAINEVVATVDEVEQTALQSAERAKAVASSAKIALDIGETGLASVEESVNKINQVQNHTETIAREILALTESAQAISEIITAVNDITEQTNILALNAGIEAAKAGEQGAGFTVVAREIKALAKESKMETVRVRSILSEIQKATNNVVMVTEKGSKAVEDTVVSVVAAGDTISALVSNIKDATISANQISASTQQQSIGMKQVQQAINDINEAVSQTTSTSRQVEKVALDLRKRGEELKNLLRIN